MNELEKLIESLWFASDECVPCEYDIKCPFYDYNEEDNTYCRDGNCVAGMALLVKKILKEN